MVRQRPWVAEETHSRMKKFAADKGLDLQDAYDQLIQNVLNEHGENNTNISLVDKGPQL